VHARDLGAVCRTTAVLPFPQCATAVSWPAPDGPRTAGIRIALIMTSLKTTNNITA